MHAKSLQSCPTLYYPVNYNPPGSSVHVILQARIPEWVAIPFSRGWIFLTQGSSLGLLRTLHCRQILYQDYVYTAPTPVPGTWAPADGAVDIIGSFQEKEDPPESQKARPDGWQEVAFLPGSFSTTGSWSKTWQFLEHPQQAHKTSTQISSQKKDFCWFKDLRDESDLWDLWRGL